MSLERAKSAEPRGHAGSKLNNKIIIHSFLIFQFLNFFFWKIIIKIKFIMNFCLKILVYKICIKWLQEPINYGELVFI